MKNRIIFIIGLILLVVIVYATTMLAIDYNIKSKEQQSTITLQIKKGDANLPFDIF